MFGLTAGETRILKRLSDPRKIQDFLDSLPINYEKKGETYMSPRRVLREKKAHCIEGALLAALAFWMHGEEPFLMDFKTAPYDEDHVVAPFRENGYWGAVSKTNHALLRYRDPVYASPRELAMSYFHEYFMFKGSGRRTGKKTLISFSHPFNLKSCGTAWITQESDLDDIADALDAAPHTRAVPASNLRRVRTVSSIELQAGMLREWKRSDPRT